MPKKKRTKKPRNTLVNPPRSTTPYPLVEPTPKLGRPTDQEYLSQKDPLHTVILDHGAFLFMWELAHNKNIIVNRYKGMQERLGGAPQRAAEAFSEASGIEPEEPRRKGKKKRKRCPATNKRGEQCRRPAGHPPPHKIKS